MKNYLAVAMTLAGMLCVSLPAHADSRTFEGTIVSERQVVSIALTLDTALDKVAIWTDSHDDGLRFDPVAALWRDGELLALSDDGWSDLPGQSALDPTLYFGSLASGNYLLTIMAFPNLPNGSLLTDGFFLDDPAVISGPLRNCPSATDCAGGYWRVHFQDNVNLAAIPEPHAWALLLAGLPLVAIRRKRRPAVAYNAGCSS